MWGWVGVGAFTLINEMETCLNNAANEVEKKKKLRLEILSCHLSLKDAEIHPNLYEVNKLSFVTRNENKFDNSFT